MASVKGPKAFKLLMKAVRALPDEEQEVIYEYLLAGALEHRPSGMFGFPSTLVASDPARFRGAQLKRLGGAKVLYESGQARQVVPVRFSRDQYVQLKEWCESSGFSMAVVMRGLVERFLEEQGRRAS